MDSFLVVGIVGSWVLLAITSLLRVISERRRWRGQDVATAG
jgi:hypothetical protein